VLEDGASGTDLAEAGTSGSEVVEVVTDTCWSVEISVSVEDSSTTTSISSGIVG